MARRTIASVPDLRELVVGLPGTVLTTAGLGRGLIDRVVGGTDPRAAFATAQELATGGRLVSLERAWVPGSALDELVTDYQHLAELLHQAGMRAVSEFAVRAEVLAAPGGEVAAARICAIASEVGIDVMMGAGSPGQLEQVQAFVADQRSVGHPVGMTMQAQLRRTEGDCRQATGRVRLVKGASDAPAAAGTAFAQAIEVDKSYVRCAKALLARGDQAAPSFATHDPRLVDIISTLRHRYDRSAHDLEFAMYLGRGQTMQQRLVEQGEAVRVYVPFGREWLGRLMAGLVERPSGIGSVIRSLLPGS